MYERKDHTDIKISRNRCLYIYCYPPARCVTQMLAPDTTSTRTPAGTIETYTITIQGSQMQQLIELS